MGLVMAVSGFNPHPEIYNQFRGELLPTTNAFDSTAQPKVLATVFERPELPDSRLCRAARDFAAAWKRAALGGIASHAWQFRVAAADQLRFLGKA